MLSYLLSHYIAPKEISKKVFSNNEQLSNSGFEYINPLIGCTELDFVMPQNMIDLKDTLEQVKDTAVKDGKIDTASIYFRDLNNGPWIEINPQQKYEPASMFKLPTLLVLYKTAESNPSILEEVVKNTKKPEVSRITQNIKPKQTLEPDKEYKVGELVERMIEYSDNEAHDLLENYIEKNFPGSTDNIFRVFGINLEDSLDRDIIGPKQYSSFYRSLYNASYLNEEYSTRALELLTKSEFKDGLFSGVPENIKVAHKFGERGYINTSNKQLHDCGIVYAKGKPYILCVMTKGEDFVKQTNFIKKVSETVYNIYILDKK